MPRETILYASDVSYQQHVAVSLTSLLTTNPDREFDVIVLGDVPRARLTSTISRLTRDFPRSSITHRSPPTSFADAPMSTLPEMAYVSPVTYYRLLVDSVVPNDVTMALYIDADTIVRGPLGRLLDWDLGDHVLAAVPELEIPPQVDQHALGLDQSDRYFNAGVLRIDVERWRDEDVAGRCAAMLGELSPCQVPYFDQDVLNAVLRGRWTAVNAGYNHTPWTADDRADPHHGSPTIVHFAGHDKPWQWGARVPYASEYHGWLKRTAYRDVRPLPPPWQERLETTYYRARDQAARALAQREAGRALVRLRRRLRR